MNFLSISAALERKWWRVGCVIALAGLAGSLWYLERLITPDTDRLYWEYAGRLLHGPITQGYIEWVQHRVGVPPPLASAALAARVLAPYTDFPCEYPPGSLLYFAAIRYFSDSIAGFSRSFQYFSAAIFFAVIAMALRYVRKLYLAAGSPNPWLLYSVLPLVAICPLLIGPFAVNRFDMLPTFFAVAGLGLFFEDLPLAAAFMLGVGAATKLWPGIFIPLIAANYWQYGTRNHKPAMMAVLGIGGFLAPHILVIWIGTHPSDVFNYLKFLGDRPPQIESLVANITVIGSYLSGSHVSGGFDFGSQNIYSDHSRYITRIATALNAVLLIFAFFTMLSKHRKTPADAHFSTVFACGFAVCVTILCSRVFSGEYMMWPLPFVLFLLLDIRGAIGAAAFVASLILLKATYWAYDDVVAAGLGGTLISFGKNIMLLVVACMFGWRMVRAGSRRSPPATRPPTATSGLR